MPAITPAANAKATVLSATTLTSTTPDQVWLTNRTELHTLVHSGDHDANRCCANALPQHHGAHEHGDRPNFVDDDAA